MSMDQHGVYIPRDGVLGKDFFGKEKVDMEYCGVQVIMREVWVKFDKDRKLNEQADTVYTIIKTPDLKL